MRGLRQVWQWPQRWCLRTGLKRVCRVRLRSARSARSAGVDLRLCPDSLGRGWPSAAWPLPPACWPSSPLPSSPSLLLPLEEPDSLSLSASEPAGGAARASAVRSIDRAAGRAAAPIAGPSSPE